MLRKTLSLISIVFLMASCSHKSQSNNNQASQKAALSKVVFFDTDSAELTVKAEAALDKKVISWINENAKTDILIEGHCDERGSVEYNYDLGNRRAEAVKTYLINNGVKSSKIKTKSYGELKPAKAGNSERYWKENRRAVVLSLDI